MTTYAIGDVQGCYTQLRKLLHYINFNEQNDTLWFTGDLVNRGPQSLEVLRFIRELPHAQTVLGNHDLHLLAIAYGQQPLREKDTLDPLLNAPDSHELLEWLRHQPLLYASDSKKYALVHAGIAPQWSLDQALQLSAEVEAVVQGESFGSFAKQLYGNEPALWQEHLQGSARLRCIINYFTRMRFLFSDGSLELKFKGPMSKKPDNLTPWFDFKESQNRDFKILFGHWAALEGKANTKNVYALDTGCVWGNCLTAMRIEDEVRFHVAC